MERRDALRLLAATAVAPRFFDWDADELVTGLRRHLAHRHRPLPAQPTGPYRFQLLTTPQQALVDELAELIIPATDTPGARQARVVEFIDVILAEWATENDRTLFLNGLGDIDARAMAMANSVFVRAPMPARVGVCRQLDDALTAARAAGKAWREGGQVGPRPADHRGLFWHHMRSLTTSGYFTSEVGFTNDIKLVKGAAASGAEMLEAAGATDIRTENTPTQMGLCIHEMGTARMGHDPKTSVLNGWNQTHDVPNLFVTDGAAMVSSACQNPSITYMALTARAVDHAVKLFNRREL